MRSWVARSAHWCPRLAGKAARTGRKARGGLEKQQRRHVRYVPCPPMGRVAMSRAVVLVQPLLLLLLWAADAQVLGERIVRLRLASGRASCQDGGGRPDWAAPASAGRAHLRRRGGGRSCKGGRYRESAGSSPPELWTRPAGCCRLSRLRPMRQRCAAGRGAAAATGCAAV